MTHGTETRVRVVVRGRVQRVFYRATIAEVAEREGVTGWIANRPDGAVEGEFQGLPEKVQKVVEACHIGSPKSRVEEVDVGEIAPVNGARSFDVR